MRLLLFAQLKDAVGGAELTLRVAGEISADELWTQLLAVAPALAPHRRTTRLARNGEYTTPQTRFADADEVALIPPVSGG
jgi:molybdopterin converting factor subunit 1